MKLLNFFFTGLVFVIFLIKISFAEPVKVSNISIDGNKKISENTIIDLLDLKNNVGNSNDLNEYQKKLFQSNFFSSVDLSFKNKKIFIKVVENPLIDYIFIEEIKSEKLLNEIKDLLDTKENTLFSEIALNSDVKKVSSFLNSKGYFKNNIEYQVVKSKSDKVNIFFKIFLNKKFSINKIFFIGDKKIKNSKLLSIVTSKPKSFFSFFSSSNTPSSERMDYDASLLKKYYLNNGYYKVQIPNASIEIIDDYKANIVFTINAGDKFSIKTSVLEDSSNIMSKKNILFVKSILNSLENQLYNLELLKNTEAKILRYIDESSINATVAYNIKQVENKNLNITFKINEILKKSYIRNIVIQGNDLTEEKVLLNNIGFAEGDLFTNLKISNAIDNLKDTGYFKNIRVKKNEIKNSDNVDIQIDINESPTGEISAGIGAGTNESSISFNFSEKNLLGQGIGFNLGASLGTGSQTVNFNFTNPDFASSGNFLSSGFFISKYENETSGYENKLIGLNASTGFEWYEDVNLNYGIALDNDSLTAQSDASTLIKERSGDYFTNKFFYTVKQDKRGRKINTEDGYTIGFGQGIAHLGSDIPYLSNNFFGSFYNKFSESFIGSIRYKAKSINSFESSKDIKLSDRLFLSENELRGFKYRSYGPKVGNDYIGGNYAIATTFATTVPNYLPESWNSSSSLFLDAGNIWGTDFDVTTEASEMRSSIGVGLSWFSPIGPISLSYAEPIQKNASDKIENFNFKLGGVF
jgi:outer membrane protein insertion porin family